MMIIGIDPGISGSICFFQDGIIKDVIEMPTMTDGKKIKNVRDMIGAANMIVNLGINNVLIKGGHLNSKTMYDIFLNKNETSIFKNKKINTKNTHGTGCTLSSAIATYYSCGKTLKKSCEMAIKYVNHAIETGPKFGKGNGPINHLNTFIIKKKLK